MNRFLLSAAALFATTMAHGQDGVTRDAFWEHVAPLTPALYCAADVATLRATDTYSIEHVYPQSWMRQTLGCQGDACESNPAFLAYAGDMQNLMPADRSMNSARGNRAYGDLEPADDWRGQACFRSSGIAVNGTINAEGVVEPADDDKGDIARILLYVHAVHGGLLPDGQLEIAQRWSAADPVSPEECARQDAIFALQRTRNPYIVCD